MTYATVMVSLALDQTNSGPLGIARELADRYNARVIGIAASDFSPPPYFASGELAQRLLDQGFAEIRRRIGNLEDEFQDAMQGHGCAVEWRSAVDLPVRYIVQQARAADILVSGGGIRNTITDPFVFANPADLLMQLGRPLLIVPPGVTRIDLSSVLVAWKDNAEARRAVVDALPLLRQAGKVMVAGVVEADEVRETVLAAVNDVVDWLSRHHIAACARVPETKGHVSAQLDAIAHEAGAGTVVAGAYGHSRFREWILGGVTRHLVTQPAHCALLSR